MHVTGVVTITAHDTNDISERIVGFYIETAADVAVLMRDGSTAIINTMAAGVLHMVPAKRILATGTGATGVIVGLY